MLAQYRAAQISEIRNNTVRECERPRFFKTVTPVIEGITGKLLYAGTFGWIFKSLKYENQIIKVSKFGNMCEKNKMEFHVAKYAKHVLLHINSELQKLNKNVTFASTIVEQTDSSDSSTISAFHADNNIQLCYFNQIQIFPYAMEIEQDYQPYRLTNLVQLLPGRLGSAQMRCTGKTAAAERWSEIYDIDTVKSIINTCGMNGNDYGYAASFLHGCFIYLGIELHDVEFIIGSREPDNKNKPQIFLIDFDKVELLSAEKRTSRLLEITSAYLHPTILPTDDTIEAIQYGVRLGEQIHASPHLCGIRATSPCFHTTSPSAHAIASARTSNDYLDPTSFG